MFILKRKLLKISYPIKIRCQETILQQNSLERNWMPENFFLFFFFENSEAFSFLIHSHVTYGTPCHARGHSHSYLGKPRIFLVVIGILSMYLIYILNLFITKSKLSIYNRFYLSFMAARICKESAPHRIWTLSTISVACWKYFVISVWLQSFDDL